VGIYHHPSTDRLTIGSTELQISPASLESACCKGMPDPFFATGSKKRKRPSSSASVSVPRKRPATANGKLRSKNPPSGAQQPKKRIARDEELSDATEDGRGLGGVDDMDLRASDEDPYRSGSENENETPAEKRLRLAQMYIEGVKTSLAEGEYDAAEIDKELISARLKQDVLEQSGKIHLFVADSVCDHNSSSVFLLA
jgi:ribosomal RNA-processing protein 9